MVVHIVLLLASEVGLWCDIFRSRGGTMKPLLALFAFGVLASANSTFELSYPGGSYSAGSGPTYTTITLDPLDVVLSNGDNTFDDIGQVTLPETADDTFYDVGTLDITFGSVSYSPDLYTLAIPNWDAEGDEDFTLQWTGISLGGPDEELLEFRIIPVVAQPGTTNPLDLQANIDYLLPEPGTYGMTLVGLLGLTFSRFKQAGR
jgi:hypothetical protein